MVLRKYFWWYQYFTKETLVWVYQDNHKEYKYPQFDKNYPIYKIKGRENTMFYRIYKCFSLNNADSSIKHIYVILTSRYLTVCLSGSSSLRILWNILPYERRPFMNFFYKVTLSIFRKKYSTQNIFSIDIQEFSKKKKITKRKTLKHEARQTKGKSYPLIICPRNHSDFGWRIFYKVLKCLWYVIVTSMQLKEDRYG